MGVWCHSVISDQRLNLQAIDLICVPFSSKAKMFWFLFLQMKDVTSTLCWCLWSDGAVPVEWNTVVQLVLPQYFTVVTQCAGTWYCVVTLAGAREAELSFYLYNDTNTDSLLRVRPSTRPWNSCFLCGHLLIQTHVCRGCSHLTRSRLSIIILPICTLLSCFACFSWRHMCLSRAQSRYFYHPEVLRKLHCPVVSVFPFLSSFSPSFPLACPSFLYC